MFKIGLLTSTAMTAVALLLSGASQVAYARTDMHVASRDPNTRFLCTYGEFRVSAESGFDVSQSAWSGWQHVAVPVTGHGQTVRRIKLVESGYAGSQFSVGIYSNTASGFPGEPIAGGTGTIAQSSSCGRVTVSIPPTKLKPKTTYWIEETTHTRRRCRDADRRRFRPSACSGTSNSVSVYWVANPNTKRKAYVQSHWYRASSSAHPSHSSSYTSPWTQQAKGPYVKLR